MAIHLDTNTSPSSGGKIIKFDTIADIQMRRNARLAHSLSRELREVKIEFIRLVPILQDSGLMRKYGIKRDSKDLELLISLPSDESKRQAMIDDVLSFFLVREDFLITHHDIYTPGANPIYFFIISPVNLTIDEKEEKENMIREHSQQ